MPPTEQHPASSRCRDVLPEQPATEDAQAVEWLRSQEQALAVLFLEEAQNDLPVAQYADWRRAQRRRLAEARSQWIQALTDVGWRIPSGCRSLAYLRPDLLGEYDFEHKENPKDLPFTGLVTAPLSVWWRCFRDDDHRWKTSFVNRHRVGTGCPRCGKRGVSRREEEIFSSLREYFPALVSPGSVARSAPPAAGGRRLRSWRVDMLLPGQPAVVVEYDGAYWHGNREQQDRDKTADLTASGHLVVRIREHPLPAVTPHDVTCTSEQSAHDVAGLVHRRIVGLVGTEGRGPDGPSTFEAGQLELFSGSTSFASPSTTGRRNDVAVQALGALITEAAVVSHAAEVQVDRALGEYLACSLSPVRIAVEYFKGITGVKSLCSSASRLTCHTRNRYASAD